VGIGLAVGVSLAWALSSLIMSMQQPSGSPGSMGAQLVSVINPFDALAYTGSLSFIVLASVVAALMPALRAARIDPIATLRHD
jgi:ABC-type lipoprotein release transport system permease subunit